MCLRCVTDAERTTNMYTVYILSHVNKAHRQYFIHAIIINIYSFCWCCCCCCCYCCFSVWDGWLGRDGGGGGMVILWNLTNKNQYLNCVPCSHLLKYNILNTKLNDSDIYFCKNQFSLAQCACVYLPFKSYDVSINHYVWINKNAHVCMQHSIILAFSRWENYF